MNFYTAILVLAAFSLGWWLQESAIKEHYESLDLQTRAFKFSFWLFGFFPHPIIRYGKHFGFVYPSLDLVEEWRPFIGPVWIRTAHREMTNEEARGYYYNIYLAVQESLHGMGQCPGQETPVDRVSKDTPKD